MQKHPLLTEHDNSLQQVFSVSIHILAKITLTRVQEQARKVIGQCKSSHCNHTTWARPGLIIYVNHNGDRYQVCNINKQIFKTIRN